MNALAPALSTPPSPRDWTGTIKAWKAEVGATGSQRTAVEYERYVSHFIEITAPELARPAHCHAFAYAAGASGKPPAASTTIVRLAALRSFFDFARRMELRPDNPADLVKRPRTPTSTPKGLTADELLALLDVIPDTRHGLRDRAIIITDVLTALRRSESLDWTAANLWEQEGVPMYQATVKGGGSWRRELPAPAYEAIWAWLTANGTPLESLAPDALVFGITGSTFAKGLKRYAREANIGHVTPHHLRHTAAKLREETGASLQEISELLGHANLATTSRYLRRLQGEKDSGWQAVAKALGIGPKVGVNQPADALEQLRRSLGLPER